MRKQIRRTSLLAHSQQHLTTYPIGQGRYVNFALHVSDYSEEGTRIDGNGASTPATIDDVRAKLRGWDKESMVLINVLLDLPFATLFWLMHLRRV